MLFPMKRHILFLIYILFTGCLTAYALSADTFFSRYNFRFITEAEGLPNNCVTAILKDSKGYVWMATQGGVGRYDGYRFLTYTARGETDVLKSNYVYSLCEDGCGRLWIGSEGGLDWMDVATCRLVSLDISAFPELKSLCRSYIRTLYCSRNGDVWVVSDRALWCIELDAKGEVSNYFRLMNPENEGISEMTDTEAGVCAGIGNRLYRFVKADNHQINKVLIPQVEPFSEDWRISCLQSDGDFLWMGSNRGLFRYDHRSGEVKRYRYSTHRSGMLSQAYITDIHLTDEGSVIVATLNGLNVYDRSTDTFHFIRRTTERDNSTINSNAINCLYAEGENIWAGTRDEGVDLLYRKRLRIDVWDYIPATSAAQRKVEISAIDEDHEGNLWIGTVEDGLYRKELGSEDATHYTYIPGSRTSISSNSIKGLLIDSDNHLWAYTWGVGITELDLNRPGNRVFRQYFWEDNIGLESDFILSAVEDRMNQGIWFGSVRGLIFYDKHKKSFQRITFDLSDNEFDAINALLIDRKSRLWVGTTEGVFVVDLASFAQSRQRFSYTYLKYRLTDKHTTQLEKINALFQDSRGIIWLGGNGTGLYRLVSDADGHFEFENLTVRNGLPDNVVLGLAEDNEGHLWISTDNGIAHMDVGTYTFMNYSQADGLSGKGFAANAFCHSAVKPLIYGGKEHKLLAIHSDTSDTVTANMPIKIAAYRLAKSKSWSFTDEDEAIRYHESNGTLALNLTTQDYGYSDCIRFGYYLEGYDEDWRETLAGESSLTYVSLPPGHYVLHLKATDRDGHWTDKEMAVTVRVVPYFYKSVWFWGIFFLLLCGGSYGYYRYKVRLLRRRQVRLEELVSERTHELEVQNRQLEVMARRMEEVTAEKIAFFTNMAHEFRTPVTLIQGPLEQALERTKDEQTRKQLEIAGRSSRQLLALVNELMDFRKLDEEQTRFNPKPLRLSAFLEDSLSPFQAFAAERNISFNVYTRLTSPVIEADAGYLNRIVSNLMSNAVKYTPAGGRITVWVALLNSGKAGYKLYFAVSDTGNGIPPEDLERIFSRFYQSPGTVKYAAAGQGSTGIGLYVCKRIVEMQGGTIYAKNNRTGGASFRLLLPIGLSHIVPPCVKEECIRQEEAACEPLSDETLLLVDDNKDMRTYIRSLLEKDYLILEAANGVEALQLIRSRKVDLIISDLLMPGMDGIELSRQVKENLSTSHIPFLMLTAVNSLEKEKISYSIGVDEYLCKPFDAEVLKVRVRNILNLRRRYKERFAVSADMGELGLQEDSRDKMFMQRAIDFMKQNYADAEYDLERFVHDMGYSKTLVNQKLQDLTGQSIGQFMKTYRLNVSRQLLVGEGLDMNISEIAYAVGFNDPKYFTKCFKRQFGMLPSALRDIKPEGANSENIPDSEA